MLVLNKADKSKEVLLTAKEKEEIINELELLYEKGGRNISVQYNKNLSNYLSVYDDDKNMIGKIVGNSAVLISEIIGKSEDFVFMAVPTSIKAIISEIC